MISRVSRLLKYSYDQYELDETANILGHEFAFTQEYDAHYALPPLESYTPKEHIAITVDQALADKATTQLLTGEEPLIAMTHLHRAVNEPLPRHKWIDATIAAELAVKEFLIRKCPELRSLLERLPSPLPSLKSVVKLVSSCQATVVIASHHGITKP